MTCEYVDTVGEVLLYYSYAIRTHKKLSVGSLLHSPTDWSQPELVQAIKNSTVSIILIINVKVC
jgi:hypothetical protein